MKAQNKKGITPVVATILLLLIAIAMVGFAATFLGTFTRQAAGNASETFSKSQIDVNLVGAQKDTSNNILASVINRGPGFTANDNVRYVAVLGSTGATTIGKSLALSAGQAISSDDTSMDCGIPPAVGVGTVTIKIVGPSGDLGTAQIVC